MSENVQPDGPDLARGVPLASLDAGAMLAGHVGGDAVLLVRTGDSYFAVGAACTHYGAPLVDGLLVGETVRCPWHHACFSLRSGEALTAPALKPVVRWDVERRDGMAIVTRRHDASDGATPAASPYALPGAPSSIGIVGAGAAGSAAAEMMRRSGYTGAITMIGAELDVPYDRPNLSKDYLDGTAPEAWIPLRSRDFYAAHGITLLSDTCVSAIERTARRVTLDDGKLLTFDRLLLATGADPVRLDVPGAEHAHVHYLRSLADCRAIKAAAESALRAVVVGASFIGLEVAASLRMRGLAVAVIGLEARPLEKVLGPEIGDLVRAQHASHGVDFHLADTVVAIGRDTVTLRSGATLPADLVIIGIGVRPSIALAEHAGLEIDRGVVVNEFLETSATGIFAAGDIARWPDAHSRERIRVEHWVVAQRQGQVAARNMLDATGTPHEHRFNAVPFFWSRHYDMSIRYVGHAAVWDTITIDGDLSALDARARYLDKTGKVLAVATVGRDRASLEAEVAMERSERVQP